jgi:hypothetical protein
MEIIIFMNSKALINRYKNLIKKIKKNVAYNKSYYIILTSYEMHLIMEAQGAFQGCFK